MLNYAKYQTTEPAGTLHVFLQGDAPEEVELRPFAHNPLSAMRALDKRIGYISLSGRAWVSHVCQHRTVEILRDRGDMNFARCDMEYLMPSRASFAVSTQRIVNMQFSTWKELHSLALIQGNAHDPFEHTWAAIFGCFFSVDSKKMPNDSSWAFLEGGNIRKSICCIDRPRARRSKLNATQGLPTGGLA
jgi:hypothetical protein